MTILKNIFPTFAIEKKYENLCVVGIDEAGRGPLCGPVVSACAFLEKKFLQHKICNKINDSKKISKKNRLEIFAFLRNNIKYGIGVVDEKIIDEINILQATKLAMKRSYEDFVFKNKISANVILVDGNCKPFDDKKIEILPIIKGDQKSLSIAAASILAKEFRDEIMCNLHQKYPHFSWDKNAGYPTKFHIDKIKEFGICEFHRKTFEPIKSGNYTLTLVRG